MITRNELGRYLDDTVTWLAELTDGRTFVYDDRSDDGTPEHIRELGIPTQIRSNWIPSFLNDESRFRETAWRALEAAFEPTVDDWILTIDADEFLVDRSLHGNHDTVREALQRAISTGDTAVTFTVAEVFGHDQNGEPLVRIDGYWGHIQACRLVRWRPGARFHPRVEGGGSVPSNWPKPRITNGELAILHYGYADEADRVAKHARYARGRGHNPAHVASILKPANTRRWLGMPAPKAKP